jgi:hypothetical protein
VKKNKEKECLTCDRCGQELCKKCINKEYWKEIKEN